MSTEMYVGQKEEQLPSNGSPIINFRLNNRDYYRIGQRAEGEGGGEELNRSNKNPDHSDRRLTDQHPLTPPIEFAQWSNFYRNTAQGSA
jgi:hypothetical protein